MFSALILAAATTAGAAAAPPTATLDMVVPFVGACMDPGPNADRIRAAVLKGGGTLASPKPGSTAAASNMEAYLFANGGAPYSVIFDRSGTCSVVSGRVDIDVTKASLEHLVIGSSKVFDISQTEGKAHAAGEAIVVEYRLTSKNKNGGLELTLSRVTQEGKGTAIFLTRRVFAK